MNLYNPVFLVIDDHPMILTSYIRLLRENFLESTFYASETIPKAIEYLDGLPSIDVLIIDYNLSKNFDVQLRISDGQKLALYAKEKFPKAKIIMITGHEEALLIYSIHKKLRPDALLMKADVTDELLIETIRQCMIGQVFYSIGVKNVLSLLAKRQLMQQEQYIEILMLLDKGYKVQEICEIVFKSQSTVQRMLTTLKKEFDVNDLSELLKQVKLQGFI